MLITYVTTVNSSFH